MSHVLGLEIKYRALISELRRKRLWRAAELIAGIVCNLIRSQIQRIPSLDRSSQIKRELFSIAFRPQILQPFYT